MSTATSNTNVQNHSLFSAIASGAIAGLGGGIVFGMMMGMMGMLSMVGMLIGSQSAVVGFVVHMVISAGIGGVYGIVASRLPQQSGPATIAGVANGIVWWILGALVLMPILLGMPQMVFQIGQTQWLSLMGHLIYGVITALLFIQLYKRF
jgi:uncharacterized membrane protein YagU involved in acid resistance